MLRSRHGLHGVFVGSHAVSEGWVSRRQLTSGLYRKLLHNVYADPALRADHRLHAHAALLALPPVAVLGGATAAAWFGAAFAAATDPVLAIAPPTASFRGPRGVRLHRATLAAEDVMVLEDDLGVVRLTSPLRTAWDVAALEPVGSAVAYLDAMTRAQHVSRADLDSLVAGSPGRWRAARVRKVFPLVDERSESPPESWLRVACVRAGLPAPVPQFVVLADGDFLGRVDLAWPEQRLIVEYEGAHHFEGLQIRRDDARYRRLQAAGWRVIRISAADLRDLDAVVARIARALAEPVGVA